LGISSRKSSLPHANDKIQQYLKCQNCDDGDFHIFRSIKIVVVRGSFLGWEHQNTILKEHEDIISSSFLCTSSTMSLIMGSVATLALGLRPRQGVARLRANRETQEHFTCSRECKECEGMNPHTPKWTPILGVGVPKGLPNLRSVISGVKTPCLEEFFISLEIYWSVDV
jgi:hypothetical protein